MGPEGERLIAEVAEVVLATDAQPDTLRRRTARMDLLLRHAGWDASRALADEAGELHGQVLGIVGVGEIGTRLAEIAHHGHGVRVLGHQRRLDSLPAFVEGMGLEDLLARSDAVEHALVEALQARRIGGAALDVFDEQPLRAGHPLLAGQLPRNWVNADWPASQHRGSLL